MERLLHKSGSSVCFLRRLSLNCIWSVSCGQRCVWLVSNPRHARSAEFTLSTHPLTTPAFEHELFKKGTDVSFASGVSEKCVPIDGQADVHHSSLPTRIEIQSAIFEGRENESILSKHTRFKTISVQISCTKIFSRHTIK